jgi:hypothetical protein
VEGARRPELLAAAVDPEAEMIGAMIMLSNSHRYVRPADDAERVYLESLIRDAFERAHPDETLADVKRRAPFSKEDRGLLRDWMAVAAVEAAARKHAAELLIAAE